MANKYDRPGLTGTDVLQGRQLDRLERARGSEPPVTLGDLQNVRAFKVAHGDTLLYDHPSGKWVPGAPAGGKGRGATIVVAASDSSPASQAGADFVCTGTNDEVIINQAFAALPYIGGGFTFGGGKVLLLEGRYNILDRIDMTAGPVGGTFVEFAGSGPATVITPATGFNPATRSLVYAHWGTWAMVRDMSFENGTGSGPILPNTRILDFSGVTWGWVEDLTLQVAIDVATITANSIVDGFHRANNNATMGNTDTGEVWAPVTGTWGIQSDMAYSVPMGGAVGGLTFVNSAQGNGTLQATIKTSGVETDLGVVFRGADVNNYLTVLFENNADRGNQLTLMKRVGGVNTVIGSVAGFVALGTIYDLRVDFNNTQITVYVNGVQQISYNVVTGLEANTQIGLILDGAASRDDGASRFISLAFTHSAVASTAAGPYIDFTNTTYAWVKDCYIELGIRNDTGSAPIPAGVILIEAGGTGSIEICGLELFGQNPGLNTPMWAIHAEGGIWGGKIHDNHLWGGILVGPSGTQPSLQIHHNTIDAPYIPGGEAILLKGVVDSMVDNNIITVSSYLDAPAYDAIRLTAGSSRNQVTGNKVTGVAGGHYQWRHGINVDTADCADNLVTQNDLLNSGAVSSLRDNGTGTVLTLPAGNRT